MSRLITLIVLTLAMLTFASAPASAERFRFAQLNPELRAILGPQLRARGITLESASVSVTVDDCPPFCNGTVVGGICYCERNAGGGCNEPTEEAELRGRPMCRIVPNRVEVGTTGTNGEVGNIATVRIATP